MFNPDFSFLKDKNKIKEANEINAEFEQVYMNCDDWSYDDCVFHIRLQFRDTLSYLNDEEYNKVESML